MGSWGKTTRYIYREPREGIQKPTTNLTRNDAGSADLTGCLITLPLVHKWVLRTNPSQICSVLFGVRGHGLFADALTICFTLHHYCDVTLVTRNLEPSAIGCCANRCLIGGSGATWVGVQTDAILDAVKRFEEERDAKSTALSAAAKRTAMVRLGQEIPPLSGRSTLSYTSTFVPKSSPV